MKKSFSLLLLLSLVAPAVVTADEAQPVGAKGVANDVPGARFEFVADDRWGGQTLLAPRPIYCTTNANVKFQALPDSKRASILYGALPIGSKQKIAAALVRDKAGQVSVYLDANCDGLLTPTEGKQLQRGVVDWPACHDDLSSRIPIDLTVVANGKRQSVPRSAVVWVCQAPNIIFFAWQGFLRGKLDINDTQKEAFVVDANSNGVYGDTGDRLWVDLNGDGQLNVVSEETLIAPTLRLGGLAYRLTVASTTLPSLTNEMRLARLEGGFGKARLMFQPLASKVSLKEMDATLISQLGDVASANSMGEELELPIGKYQISNLNLQIAKTSEPPWKYALTSWAETIDDKTFPLQISKDTTTDVIPLRKLTLDAKVEGPKKPGATLRVVLSAKSEMGLELTSAERPGAGYGREDYAHISLLNPAGKVIATASTGFA